MRALMVAIVVSGVAGAVCAQPASQDVQTLEACFQSARETDPTCSNPANDPAQRLECIRQARTALLQCMEQVAHGGAAAVPDLPAGTVPPESAAAAAPPELPNAPAPHDQPAGDAPLGVPASVVEIPLPQADMDWVISETTSPVDYAPLITAVIRSASGTNTLVIRCRGARTELSVRGEGASRASRGGEVQVVYQVNDQSPVRLVWSQSPDGKTVSYKQDASTLVRSLPEGARLKISLVNAADSGRDAAFQLTGIDVVRKKLGTACRWTPANTISSGKL